jgi:hypothetical protein
VPEEECKKEENNEHTSSPANQEGERGRKKKSIFPSSSFSSLVL